MKKYEFTGEVKSIDEKMLHRIRAVRDIPEHNARISVPTQHQAARGTSARHTVQAGLRRVIGRKVGRLAGCMGIRHAKETHRCLKG